MGAWSAEEDRILIDNFDKSKGQIAKVLRSYGYERTEDGVRRRRQRLRIAGTIPDTYISSTMTTEEDLPILPSNPLVDAQIGFSVKRVSTNYDGDGNIRQQWVSEDKDKEEILDQMKQAIEALIEPVKGLSLGVPSPVTTCDDLMVVYPAADIHFGLYADKEEIGVAYNMDVAEKILNDAMIELVQSVPSTETCLIANLGDLFHTDTVLNRTMKSGHVLDVDGRWHSIIQRGVAAYRNIINLALQKHKKVIVKSGLGNHDLHSSLTLAMLMQAYFEGNDRVEVELPISNFAYYKFGKNLLGLTHGDGIKSANLPGIMACDRASDWGETTHRFFYTGHKHHRSAAEYPGCIVELFRAVCSKDSWTNSSGYRSTRTMEAVVLAKSGGEHARHIVNIS